MTNYAHFLVSFNANSRGASIGWAYTDEDPECPAKTGNTWKYTDGSWKEAKDGLKVQCKNLKS